MPNQNSYPGFVRKLGFNNIGAIPLYLKPIKPSNMIKDFLKYKFLSAIVKPFDVLFDVKRIKNDENMKFVKFDMDNLKLADEFWNKIKD